MIAILGLLAGIGVISFSTVLIGMVIGDIEREERQIDE